MKTLVVLLFPLVFVLALPLLPIDIWTVPAQRIPTRDRDHHRHPWQNDKVPNDGDLSLVDRCSGVNSDNDTTGATAGINVMEAVAPVIIWINFYYFIIIIWLSGLKGPPSGLRAK